MDLDQTNDVLDPEKGFRLSAKIAPYVNLKTSDEVFFKTEGGASAYLQLQPNHRLTLAAWAKAGAILGEDLSMIPVQKRFYLGGAGSIRGFAAKELSPNGTTGGVAKLEGGIELRRRFTPALGGVAFIEAGQVYDDIKMPQSNRWHAGAGLGLRYFSNFGPVRADIAIPISQKSDWSDVEILVGLGQAF